MKKIIFTAVSALAFAGFADGVSSTEFAAMYVPSTTTNTIVSVPWIQSCTSNAAVKVSDLVVTAGLSVGDTLDLYDPTTRAYSKSWRLTSSKEWEAADESYQDATIPLGSALKLTRTNPNNKGFHIMGKPTETGVAITLGAGYSLIAPPSTGDTDVNDGITWDGIAATDKLMIPSATENGKFETLSFVAPIASDDSVWCTVDRTTMRWVKSTEKIKMGTGAWFVNSTDGTKTFTLE